MASKIPAFSISYELDYFHMVQILQAAGIPLRRFGKVDDMVGAVEFLGSDMSQYVTGECIAVLAFNGETPPGTPSGVDSVANFGSAINANNADSKKTPRPAPLDPGATGAK